MTYTTPPAAAPSDRKIAERIWKDWKRPSSSHDNDIVDMIEHALSAARREARAAAIEECAKVADDWGYRHLYREPEESLVHRSEQIAAAGFISHAIRSLLPAPEPTKEPS